MVPGRHPYVSPRGPLLCHRAATHRLVVAIGWRRWPRRRSRQWSRPASCWRKSITHPVPEEPDPPLRPGPAGRHPGPAPGRGARQAARGAVPGPRGRTAARPRPATGSGPRGIGRRRARRRGRGRQRARHGGSRPWSARLRPSRPSSRTSPTPPVARPSPAVRPPRPRPGRPEPGSPPRSWRRPNGHKPHPGKRPRVPSPLSRQARTADPDDRSTCPGGPAASRARTARSVTTTARTRTAAGGSIPPRPHYRDGPGRERDTGADGRGSPWTGLEAGGPAGGSRQRRAGTTRRPEKTAPAATRGTPGSPDPSRP